MSSLADYVGTLPRLAGAPKREQHTLRNYAADLEQFSNISRLREPIHRRHPK